MITVAESVGGFLAGSAVGVVLALAIASSKLLSRALLPLIVASQVVPKPAIAPVILVLVGYGVHAGVVIGATIAFFPVVMTYAYGLLSVPSDMLDLARSVRAGPVRTFFKIRLPHSLPALFAGLKTASSLAVIGAVVGEFVGASQGLGYVVLQANAQINTPLLYSAIILLALLGIGMFVVLSWIEAVVVGARGEMETGSGVPGSSAM
jgi:NitT/TauT family transport system permease protein